MRSPSHPLAAAALAGLLLVPACDKGGDKKVEVKAETKKADANKAEDEKANEAEDEKAAAVDDEKTDEPEAVGEPVLTLGKAKIMQEDRPEESMEIDADGTVLVNTNKVGSITVDGKLRSADGQVMMKVDAEGKLSMGDRRIPLTLVAGGANMESPDGSVIELRFAEDGSISMAAKNADGSAVEPAPDAPAPPPMIAEGCTGEVAKVCGLAFAAYMMLGSAHHGGAPGGPAEGPAEVPGDAPPGAGAPPTAPPGPPPAEPPPE